MGISLRSIGSALAETKGKGPGFDALRLALALAVFVWHSFPVASGVQAMPVDGPWWILVYCPVPMFFALSGFLVTASAQRLAIWPFVVSRVLRIVPPLSAGTALAVLGLGLAFTTLPKGEYLLHPETLGFWLTSLGMIHYQLPGVFTQTPLPQVNASLWTIPAELCCYAVLAALMFVGWVGRWQAALAGIVILFGVDLAYHAFGARFSLPFERQFAGESGKLIAIFLLGLIVYVERGRIPCSGGLAALAACGLLVAAFLGTPALAIQPAFIAVSSLAMTYLVVWLGCQPLGLPWPFGTGSYSYGLFIYGFPIQQAVVHLTGTRSGWVVLGLSLPVALALAVLSWHGVEKPALALRRRIAPRRPPARPASTATP